MRSRDDFSEKTKNDLAKRVGYLCSNPDCRRATTGPKSTSIGFINIGVACHITAASNGGPRYDLTLSQNARKSIENGIWLCQNCSKLIDNDKTKFTKETLTFWKQQAENEQFTKVSSISYSVSKISDDDEKILLLKELLRYSKAGFYTDLSSSNTLMNLASVGLKIFPLDVKNQIKVLDIIGSVKKNRISLLLSPNNVLKLVVIDCNEQEYFASFQIPSESKGLFVLLNWDNSSVQMWYGINKVAEISLLQPIRGNILALTIGLDINAESGSHYIVQGARYDKQVGIGLCNEDKQVQAIIGHLFLRSTKFVPTEIEELNNLATP